MAHHTNRDGAQRVDLWAVFGRCRYFLLLQTGPNEAGRHHLTLGGFELYGQLREQK